MLINELLKVNVIVVTVVILTQNSFSSYPTGLKHRRRSDKLTLNDCADSLMIVVSLSVLLAQVLMS